MIKGRFGNTSGRPYIDGYLEIPHLNLRGTISFVLDTGSDCTVLMPLDAARFKLNYSQLQNAIQDESQGFGGKSMDFIVPASLLIKEDGPVVHGYEIDLRVAKPKDGTEDIPSIIGRDVIDRWRITYHPLANIVQADVITSDRKFDL